MSGARGQESARGRTGLETGPLGASGPWRLCARPRPQSQVKKGLPAEVFARFEKKAKGDRSLGRKMTLGFLLFPDGPNRDTTPERRPGFVPTPKLLGVCRDSLSVRLKGGPVEVTGSREVENRGCKGEGPRRPRRVWVLPAVCPLCVAFPAVCPLCVGAPCRLSCVWALPAACPVCGRSLPSVLCGGAPSRLSCVGVFPGVCPVCGRSLPSALCAGAPSRLSYVGVLPAAYTVCGRFLPSGVPGPPQEPGAARIPRSRVLHRTEYRA